MNATHQNTVLPTGSTAEEQFAQIQAASRQLALNDIWEHKQPTTVDQIQDISSSSTKKQAPPVQVDTIVTTSMSSFKIVHQDDNTQTVSHVPRIQNQHLQVPIDPQNIQDIWSDDNKENITAINIGTSALNVKTQMHINVVTEAKLSIEVDQTDTDDADDKDVEYFRQISEHCAVVNIKIATKSFCSC